jgi:hypothetical protein
MADSEGGNEREARYSKFLFFFVSISRFIAEVAANHLHKNPHDIPSHWQKPVTNLFSRFPPNGQRQMTNPQILHYEALRVVFQKEK